MNYKLEERIKKSIYLIFVGITFFSLIYESLILFLGFAAIILATYLLLTTLQIILKSKKRYSRNIFIVTSTFDEILSMYWWIGIIAFICFS